MHIPKVLIADPISQRGVDLLAEGGGLEVVVKTGVQESELLSMIPEFSALIVRSQTKVTKNLLEAATRLKVVGRAGVGVDNVDVPAATQRGIIIMNTPGGNTISTAEHAFSLLLSIARSIPQAHASVLAGKWHRKDFEGVELYNKTIGILGMGRIGAEIARRCTAFGMRVLAYDPYLSPGKARMLQVELFENLDDLLSRVDFLTLHMPFTKETYHIIDSRRLHLMKKGARIINCARGGLIDEQALYQSLQNKHIGSAALDVYEVEPPPSDYPLRGLPNVVFTPHLGASTAEAQESVGIEIAQAIRALLLNGEIRNAVNVPSIDAKTLSVLGPWLQLCECLGRFLSQIAPKRCEELSVGFSGGISQQNLVPLTRSVLTGFLRQSGGSEVNQVNAPTLANSLGLRVTEIRHSDSGEFSEWIEARAISGEDEVSVRGTFFGSKPRLVMINHRFVEAVPEGVILILENRDRPGIVGHVGTILGEYNINIASMSLGRLEAGGHVLTLLNLDTAPAENLMQRLAADPDIFSARVIQLNGA
ncbi:MAG: phosphoglycerate dehydrogenase [Verrucomicrobia bacterium]|nr:MAG: phosphoglycerate dehydrogenase [Verrucomicrobiota bacterium]